MTSIFSILNQPNAAADALDYWVPKIRDSGINEAYRKARMIPVTPGNPPAEMIFKAYDQIEQRSRHASQHLRRLAAGTATIGLELKPSELMEK